MSVIILLFTELLGSFSYSSMYSLHSVFDCTTQRRDWKSL